MESYFLPTRRQEIQDLWLPLNVSLSLSLSLGI